MSLFSTHFLRRCDGLHQEARRCWGRRFLGRDVQLQLAGGTEVTGYLDYTAGDDFRYVDWNRCARHDELLSKQYRGSASEKVYLLIDSSVGMGIGSPSKFDFARQLGGGLAHLAISNHDSVEIAGAADTLQQVSPPTRGKDRIPQALQFIDSLSQTEAPSDLPEAVGRFLRTPRRGGLVIVLSDFWTSDYRTAADMLRRQGMTTFLLQVAAPEELEPDIQGAIRFRNVAGAGSLSTQIENADLIRYQEAVAEFGQAMRGYCRQYGVGYAQLRSDQSIESALAKVIRVGRARLAARRG